MLACQRITKKSERNRGNKGPTVEEYNINVHPLQQHGNMIPFSLIRIQKRV